VHGTIAGMTRLRARTLVMLAAGVLVSGCGDDKVDNGADTDAGPHYSTIDELATALGCSSLKPDDGMAGTEDGGYCTDKDGDDVMFSLFGANVTRDNVISLGVTKGSHYVYGDRFLVECTSAAEMRRAAKLLPGSSTQD
jgi:hypothetical protein